MPDVGSDHPGSVLVVRAPLAGTVHPLAEAPDTVFAGGLLGPGVVLDPVRGDGEPVPVVAPIDGTLVKVHPHAFVVAAADGRAVLVHLGLDTVQLRGTGFDVRAAEGDAMTVGDVVVTWHPGAVEATGRSPLCPVVALEAAPDTVRTSAATGDGVAPGDLLLEWPSAGQGPARGARHL